MDEHKTNNFDFIRLLAASMVVFSHSFYLLATPQRPLSESEPLKFLTGGQMTFGNLGVWIFFAISGYLITQSMLRSSGYATYFTKRSLRIFPALIVDIVIAAFIWGPIVTTISLVEYFSSYETYRYVLNVNLYRIVYELPGVFTQNPLPNFVNGSLWTLPFEFTCYIGVVVLHFLFILRNRKVYAAFYFLSLLAWAIIYQTKYFTFTIPILHLPVQHFTLSIYFGMGALFFLYRDKIPLRFSLSMVLLAIWGLGFYLNMGVIFSYLCLPYITFWFVYEPKIKLHGVARIGDFSYGLYIYSWTVQQTIIHFLGAQISWLAMCVLSFLFTIPLAMFSWFVIEKKALRLKDELFKKDAAAKQEAAVTERQELSMKA
ncbi:MAG TPA: acyltransferase [Pyrinomonadaceae bacterium]|nr:acyltransferase [Pyrinomonadaceae bacterium]